MYTRFEPGYILDAHLIEELQGVKADGAFLPLLIMI